MKKVTETAPTMTHKSLKKEKTVKKSKEAVNLLDGMSIETLKNERSLIKVPVLTEDQESNAKMTKEYEAKLALVNSRIAKLEKKEEKTAVIHQANPEEIPDNAKVFPGEVYIVDNHKEYRNTHMGITFKDLKKIEGFRTIRRKNVSATADAPEQEKTEATA